MFQEQPNQSLQQQKGNHHLLSFFSSSLECPAPKQKQLIIFLNKTIFFFVKFHSYFFSESLFNIFSLHYFVQEKSYHLLLSCFDNLVTVHWRPSLGVWYLFCLKLILIVDSLTNTSPPTPWTARWHGFNPHQFKLLSTVLQQITPTHKSTYLATVHSKIEQLIIIYKNSLKKGEKCFILLINERDYSLIWKPLAIIFTHLKTFDNYCQICCNISNHTCQNISHILCSLRFCF